MDKTQVLAWLADLSQQAITEARGGDAMLANRIGGNPALAHYLNNVATRHSVNPQAWAEYYPQYMAEATRVFEAYQADQEREQHDDRLTALEAKFNELAEMLKPLLEAQAEPEPEPEPAPKKRKARRKAVKVEEAEAEQEAEPENDDAENIAEAAGSDADADDEPADEVDAEEAE